MPDIRDMIGKDVEVMANGVQYRGILIEVSDAEVHLKTSMQWLALPVPGISSIRPVPARPLTEEAGPAGGGGEGAGGE